MENNIDREERDIDLLDLGKYILKKWPLLLAALLFGALLGGAFSFVKAKNVVPLEDRVLNMDTENLNMDRIQMYADSMRLYKDGVKYSKESPLMALNANAVYTGKLKYALVIAEEDLTPVRELYAASLNDPTFLSELMEKGGLEYPVDKVSELLTQKYESELRGETLMEGSGDDAREVVLYNGTVTVTLLSASEESAEAMMEVVRTRMENIALLMEASYAGSYVLRTVEDNVTFGMNGELGELQYTVLSRNQEYLTQAETLVKNMSGDEKDYYDYYFENKTEDEAPGFSKRFVLLGGVGLPVLLALVFVLIYVFSGKIRTAEDVETQTPGRVISVVPKNDMEYTLKVLSLLEFGKAVLLSEEKDKKAKAFAEALASGDSRLVKTESPETNSDAVKAITESDGVVFVVKTMKTELRDLKREMQIVRDNGKKVFGVVVLR